MADCLRNVWNLIKQNKLFDRINDVIFDDPYMTEQKDSAIVTKNPKHCNILTP